MLFLNLRADRTSPDAPRAQRARHEWPSFGVLRFCYRLSLRPQARYSGTLVMQHSAGSPAGKQKEVRGPEIGKRKRVTRKADGKQTRARGGAQAAGRELGPAQT